MIKTSVLYIDNTFTFGGAINSLLYLIKALDRTRYHPVLITGHQEKNIGKAPIDITLYTLDIKLPWINNHIFKRIIKLPIFKIRILLKAAIGFRFLYWLIFYILPEAHDYYRIGKQHKVSLVHLNNIFSTQLSGIIASKMLKVPCVAHLRDFETNSFMIRRYARMVDHHVAISSAVQESLLRLGIPGERVSLIHDAIDIGEFDPGVPVEYLYREFNLKKKSVLLGLFGRIIPWKGVREFILAAHEVLKEVGEARAFIVGGISDGTESYHAEVKNLVRDLRLEDRIIFTGYRKDVPNLMKLMDVIVHASIKPEPFGMVIIEGMAMGKPVVATTSGGPMDIVVDGETGFLVPPRDTGAMAGAILTLLRNPALRQEFGSNGRQRIERLFTNKRYARETEIMYALLLSK